MKTILVAAAAMTAVAVAGPVTAQQGRQITQEDIAGARTLFEQIKGPCAAGSPKKSCGVLAYAPENCDAKKKDAHIRQVYNTYDDGTVRFQQGQNGVGRRPPLALMVPIGIIGRDGATTMYASPQFVSWDEYQGGKKSVEVCGKSSRIQAGDFTIAGALEKFLKANP